MRMVGVYEVSCVPECTRYDPVATSAKQGQADIARPFAEERKPKIINTAREHVVARDVGTATKPDRKKSVNGWCGPNERCDASGRSTKNENEKPSPQD